MSRLNSHWIFSVGPDERPSFFSPYLHIQDRNPYPILYYPTFPVVSNASRRGNLQDQCP